MKKELSVTSEFLSCLYNNQQKTRTMKNIALSIAFLLIGFAGISQEMLTSEEKEQNIASVAKLMDSIYVIPEKAKEAIALVKQQQAKGAYDKIDSPYDFAEALTKDLRAVTHDLHINVHFAPAEIAKEQKQAAGEKAGMTQAERLAMENYGFEEVKVLPGNVGYLDLRFFYTPKEASETAVATMNYLANTDAIIFDLRRNGGGNTEMIQLLVSYLFDQEPVHLNNFYYRPTDKNTQTWTLPYVPGKRNPDADVYVLTSNRTFSAGEEFVYDLKNLERATIIGEHTGGGANPGTTYEVSDKFKIFIPSGRAINPVSGDNWEGKGIAPDVAVDEDEALNVAHLMAVKKLLEKADSEEKKAFYKWDLKEIKANQQPVNPETNTLRSYTGSYGGSKVTLEDGQLIYHAYNDSFELIPMGDDEFMLPNVPYKRIKFSKDRKSLTEASNLFPDLVREREK
jgi:hypothetical protein